MSTTKHTPGEWHTGTKHPCRVIAPDKGIIAFCCLPDDEGAESELDKSNSRLIAASPELLEACRLLMQWAEAYKPRSGVELSSRNADLNIAKAAIDKATKGEAE